MSDGRSQLSEMSDRSREVFRRVVEGYLEIRRSCRVADAGAQPVRKDQRGNGSQCHAGSGIHGTAGQPPCFGRSGTDPGRFANVCRWPARSGARGRGGSGTDRRFAVTGQHDVGTLLDRVGSALSGITRGASLVLAPKQDAPIKHLEFVSLGPDRALVVLVLSDGHVENRIFTPPPGLTPSSMREATNFLNALAEGKTLSELRKSVAGDIQRRRKEIDTLARAMVESGLAVWEDAGELTERLIVREGQT